LGIALPVANFGQVFAMLSGIIEQRNSGQTPSMSHGTAELSSKPLMVSGNSNSHDQLSSFA
jgi:hypothetical protein